MNKKIWIAVGLIVIVGLAWAISDNHSKTGASVQKPIVKIGITLPLTGDIAMLGESNRKAILLAQSRLKNTKYDYQLVIEDDGFKPATGALTTGKLISVDKVNALISFGSPVGNVVSVLTEKAGVPHVNDFASDPHVAVGDYNFVHYTPASQDAIAFIAELKKRGIKSFAIFTQQDNPGAIAISQAVNSIVSGSGIAITSEQKFNTGTRDFRTLIGKARSGNPDVYLLEASTPELETVTKQLRDAGITTPVTSVETFEFSDQLSLFEGMWYVNGADQMDWFVKIYQDTYKESPKLGAANGYDALNMIVTAIEEISDGKTVPSGAQIKDALASMKGFNGALGSSLNMGPDHLVQSKAVIRIIKDGKPMTIEK